MAKQQVVTRFAIFGTVSRCQRAKHFHRDEPYDQQGQAKDRQPMRRAADPHGYMKRVFTDMAIIDVESNGLVLHEVLPGMPPDDIQMKTVATLKIAADCRKIGVRETFKGIQSRL